MTKVSLNGVLIVNPKKLINKPTVSIITVVYNGAEHIRSAIQSVLGQEYSSFEYIIIVMRLF